MSRRRSIVASLLSGLLLWAQPVFAAIAIINCASATGTTGAISTTGATLIVATNATASTACPTDSQGNTWTSVVNNTGGSLTGNVTICYVNSPTTSGSHTFSGNGTFAAVAVCALSGTDTSTPLDTSVSATTTSPGSIAPAASGELFVTAATYGNTTTGISISDPNYTWTVQANINGAGRVSYGVVFGTVISTGTATATPTWSQAGTPGDVFAAFKAGAGGGGGATSHPCSSLTLLGVGCDDEGSR